MLEIEINLIFILKISDRWSELIVHFFFMYFFSSNNLKYLIQRLISICYNTFGDIMQNIEFNDTKDKLIKKGILGFLIGLAIIIPGVSGSTIAIIFKLYKKILYAISNLFKQFKLSILFLTPIVIGAILGFICGFFTVQKLLNLIPFALVSLFAGLMLGATPTLKDEVKEIKIGKKQIINIIIGFFIPIILTISSLIFSDTTPNATNKLPINFPSIILYILLGFLVAATQFVPGCSATAILMSVGYYKSLTDSVSISYITKNPSIIIVYLSLIIGFLLGCAIVSKVINALIDKFKNSIYFIFIGLSLGSIIGLFVNIDMIKVYAGWFSSNNFPYLDILLGIGLFVIGTICAYQLVLYIRRHDKK